MNDVTPENPNTSADPAVSPTVAVVDVFVAADGALTLQSLDGATALKVPLTVDGTPALAARQVVDWACLAGGLRIAMPAGQA